MVCHNEKHHTSTVFVVTNEAPKKVILLHHKKFNKWMPPGGHQEFHENSFETAIREVKEEAGIDIGDHFSGVEKFTDRASLLPLPKYILEENIDEYNGVQAHYHLDSIYIVEIPLQDITNNDGESLGIRWFGKEDLEDLDLFDNVRLVLNRIL